MALGAVIGLQSAGSSGSSAVTREAQVLSPQAIAARIAAALADVNATLGYQGAAAVGTGIVLTLSGEVLTSNHVIQGATSIVVTDVGNGRRYRADVAGYDQSRDLAVLQLRRASGLRAVTLGDSAALTIGQRVVALGNAYGKGGAPHVAAGKIAALGASITASDQASGTTERLRGLIRTSAAIRPGDSGGPLVSTAGQVTGVDTAGSPGFQMRQSGTHQSYAVPASQAGSIAAQIVAGRASPSVHIGPTAFLGVRLLPFGAIPAGGNSGTTSRPAAVAAWVGPGSPAARVGLTAGDAIVSLAGHRITSPEDVRAAMNGHRPGDSVSLGWVDQAGQRRAAAVVLAVGPVG